MHIFEAWGGLTTNKNTAVPSTAWVLSQLGSRSFLEPKLLLVLVLPSAIIFSILNGEVTDPRIDYGIFALANLVSIPLVAIAIVMFRYVWKKLAIDFVFPFVLVLLISAGFGALKGLITALMVIELSGSRLLSEGPMTNVIGASLSGLVGFSVASAAGVLFSQFNYERNLLLTTKVSEELKKKTSIEQKQLLVLRDEIKQLIEKLKGSNSPSTPHMELDFIRELVDKTVRPLASAMFRSLDARYPSFALRQLFEKALTTSPLALPVALISLTGAPLHIVSSGVLLGIAFSLAIAVAVFLTVKLMATLFKNQSNAVAFFFVSTIAPTFVSGAIIEGFDLLGQRMPALYLTIGFLYGNTSVLASMALIALKTARSNQLEVRQMQQDQDPQSFAVLNRQRKEVANQLHGEVQSRLMSLVLREEAGVRIDKELAIQELMQISKLLELGPSEQISLQQSVSNTVSKWKGFAEIQVLNLETEIEDAVVAEIIDEGVSNAFRHGMADTVTIKLEKNQLTITDNGIGPTSGKPGIGSQLLDSASDDWELLQRADGGSELVVNFPAKRPRNAG